MLGLLSTIIRGRERANQKSANHGKIALAHEHNWALITSTSTRGVARTSARHLGHHALVRFFLDCFSPPPTPPHTTIWIILRWGWVFLERTQILSGIQLTSHCIEIFVVETKRFVGSFVNMILTWQPCGQRSSRAAESKHQALGNYFSERICYMFLISKYRGDQDLGLCTTSVLAFGEPQRNGKIRFSCVETRFLADVATSHWFSKRKYRSCAQPWISVSSTFWY